MQYRVLYVPEVKDAIWERAGQIAREASKEVAIQWVEGLIDAIEELDHWPRRFPVAPENDSRPYEIRKLNYGNYLVLYRVRDEDAQVQVIGFRHGARQPRPDDLPDDE